MAEMTELLNDVDALFARLQKKYPTQCQWCIAFHVKHASAAGATRDQIAEAGFMAVLMHGGPALMYLVPLFKALDEFLPE